jgi:peptide chain release factor 2
VAEIDDVIQELRRDLEEADEYLKIDRLKARLPQLETEMGRPDLWDDSDRAREVQTEFTSVKSDLDLYDELDGQVDDLEALAELAAEEGDGSLDEEIAELSEGLIHRFAQLELRALFTGEYDQGDAVCEIHSGAGGTDSQDWAEMLYKMYERWAKNKGFTIVVDDWQEGAEAGITTAVFTVRGRYAYGLLQAERGVHRLVRISPFDQQARRHTAFASFSVWPDVEESAQTIDIPDKDLRVDVFRSSGAGGQHVNTTDSAVRITHLPTGTVVSSQDERSQHQNRETCMKKLTVRLLELERQKREDELAAEAGESKSTEWGSQIRSYVLQPYEQVKDERSSYTSGNPKGVLDGDVEPFMEAWLRWRRH